MWTALYVVPALLGLLLYKLFVVPQRLAHIPRVSVIAQLKSYIAGESEDQRIKRLILPFANEHGHPIVLGWIFGVWIVHVMDYKIGQAALKDRTWVRQLPPQDLMLWKFVGQANVAFTIGDVWRRHSRIVIKALSGSPPFADFSLMAHKLFSVLGGGTKTVKWDELSQQVTLDILGTTVLGHDFEAIKNPDSPFARGYRQVMHALTEPPYVFLPFLDKYFPRRDVEREAQNLRKIFSQIIEYKRTHLADDLISHMIANPEFSDSELLDNVVVLFVAGHDTTSGGLASLVYYLAQNPDSQAKAREEVLSVLTDGKDPTMNTVTRMPYVFACIKEAMRMNNPSNGTLPRSAAVPTQLGSYTIPPNTLMMFNISALHHLESEFKEHDRFNPERFMVVTDDNAPVAFFGLGLRQCPARNFAMWELRTVTALLLKEYEWHLPKASPHTHRVHNAFSFSTNLNLPLDLDIVFTKRQ